MKLLGHKLYMCLGLTDTAKQFYDVVVLVYTSIISISEFQLLCILDKIYCHLPFSITGSYVVALHCSFNAHFF